MNLRVNILSSNQDADLDRLYSALRLVKWELLGYSLLSDQDDKWSQSE